jgi:hypothetical protein
MIHVITARTTKRAGNCSSGKWPIPRHIPEDSQTKQFLVKSVAAELAWSQLKFQYTLTI